MLIFKRIVTGVLGQVNLTGNVSDTSGTAIEGATVALASNPATLNDTTDASGGYAISGNLF